MKKLILLFLLAFLFVGCVTPDIPPPIISPIVCEGGHYTTRFKEWKICGCPSCKTYPAGTLLDKPI